jgi:hypothetical protein
MLPEVLTEKVDGRCFSLSDTDERPHPFLDEAVRCMITFLVVLFLILLFGISPLQTHP